MRKNSINAYDLPARVASYDADMDIMHPNRSKMVRECGHHLRDREATRSFLSNLEGNEADQPVTLMDDLQILKDADLKDVSVFWLEYREVVYGGRLV